MKTKTLVSGYSYYYPEVLTHKCLKRYSTDFNSNKSPLPGVQLTATDAPATDTDASGNFQFNFSKQKPGMAIASPNVYKKGYELVNKDMINGWILSENVR